MQCMGRTKLKKRCRNSAKFFFCNKHLWQPFSLVVSLFLIIGFFAGFFQDLIKPLSEKFERDNELQKVVTVEIKNDRRTVAEWENNPDPTNGKSDVVTIFLDRQPVKSLEIYHNAKDQRFKDYPPTFLLADFFMPTAAAYQVIDLDKDGVNEIVLILTNQLYSLHHDKQVNVLIYNPMGDLLARTPYPQDISGLKLEVLNSYSAYKTTVTMKDETTGLTQSTTFANDFNIVTRDNNKYLQFSWVIDNAGYIGQHLHQVEEFQYSSGKLVPVLNKPKLYINDSWENATSGQYVESIQQASDFLKKNNQPKFADMVKDAEKSFPSKKEPNTAFTRPPINKRN
jgi:hypothetical protein